MAVRQPNASCEVCGTAYWVQSTRLATSRFCSNACKHAASAPAAKDELARLYYQQHLSMQEIAGRLQCSQHKIAYWMDRYGLERRDLSEAVYVRRNPDGEPFAIRLPETIEDKELFALAIGLYMGEGTKRGKHGVSLANANPAIHQLFLRFLETFCGISRKQTMIWLNVFDDCDVEQTIQWWCSQLEIEPNQFCKTVVRTSKGGTYTNKSKYGTLTVAFCNIKLKQYVDNWCTEYYERFSGTIQS